MTTGIWRTIINIISASWSSPARRAHTLKSCRRFQAASSVVARIRETGMLRDFTVLSRVTLRAGTLVFIGTSVAAGTTVQTGWVGSTVVQIFVTELTTPVGFTEALPWFNASAMDTSWVWNALITVLALPSILTPALSWNCARTMLGATSLTTNSFVAFWSHPALQAGFVAILVTGMVSEEVISRSTKLVAAKAIVMFCASHTDLILKVGNSCVMLQCLPLTAWIDHARVRCLLDYAIRIS